LLKKEKTERFFLYKFYVSCQQALITTVNLHFKKSKTIDGFRRLLSSGFHLNARYFDFFVSFFCFCIPQLILLFHSLFFSLSSKSTFFRFGFLFSPPYHWFTICSSMYFLLYCLSFNLCYLSLHISKTYTKLLLHIQLSWCTFSILFQIFLVLCFSSLYSSS
jgi:hypothetical protein